MKTPDENFKKQQQEWDINEAKSTLIQWKAMKILIKEDLLAAEINICGMTNGLCNIKNLGPVIDHEIREIEKFLKGKPNEWE